MKLSCISETISRRGFLKGIGAAAAAAALPGPSSLAPAAQAAQAAPAAAAIPKMKFVIPTYTHYGRGGPPDLSSQFHAVNDAAAVANRLASGPIGNAVDEDFMFTGELSPNAVEDVLFAMENEGEEVEIEGLEGAWRGYDEEDSYYFENQHGETFRVYKGDFPDWMGAFEPAKEGESPIQQWWNNYGGYGDEPIDREAMEVIKQEGLDMGNRYNEEEYWEEEMADQEARAETQEKESENRWNDERYASPMHQPFESQLNFILANLVVG